MFSVRKIGFIVVVLFCFITGSIIIKNKAKNKELEKIIMNIDLNQLKGDFIVVTDYSNDLEFRIDKIQFELEMDIYLDTINENIEYDYLIEQAQNGFLIKVDYKLKNKIIKKEYYLSEKK